jgi:uncharacterized protein (DUF1778 family)
VDCRLTYRKTITLKPAIARLSKPAARETLNLRISAPERSLIDRAAEEELLDRTIFVVSPAAYSKFLAMLDAPPQPNERLRRTMRATPPGSKA